MRTQLPVACVSCLDPSLWYSTNIDDIDREMMPFGWPIPSLLWQWEVCGLSLKRDFPRRARATQSHTLMASRTVCPRLSVRDAAPLCPFPPLSPSRPICPASGRLPFLCLPLCRKSWWHKEARGMEKQPEAGKERRRPEGVPEGGDRPTGRSRERRAVSPNRATEGNAPAGDEMGRDP